MGKSGGGKRASRITTTLDNNMQAGCPGGKKKDKNIRGVMKSIRKGYEGYMGYGSSSQDSNI